MSGDTARERSRRRRWTPVIYEERDEDGHNGTNRMKIGNHKARTETHLLHTAFHIQCSPDSCYVIPIRTWQ